MKSLETQNTNNPSQKSVKFTSESLVEFHKVASNFLKNQIKHSSLKPDNAISSVTDGHLTFSRLASKMTMIVPRTCTYSDFVEEFFGNNEFRLMLEKISIPFVKSMFLSDGSVRTILSFGSKKSALQKSLTISRFTETSSKVKIFISKCFEDLKKAFLFYNCIDMINYYQTYNEFIEKISSSQQYKTKLKQVNFIGLFESANENFTVEKLKFSNLKDKGKKNKIVVDANYYHKLAFYRHFKKLIVVEDNLAENEYVAELMRSDPDRFIEFAMHRLFWLIQTVFKRTVDDFQVSFLKNGEEIGVISIDKIELGSQSFANSEEDEDNFEAVILPKPDLNRPSMFNKIPTRLSFIEVQQFEETQNKRKTSARFLPIFDEINATTQQFLVNVKRDFERNFANNFESDVGFKQLFPESEILLSTVLKYNEEHHLLDSYSGNYKETYKKYSEIPKFKIF